MKKIYITLWRFYHLSGIRFIWYKISPPHPDEIKGKNKIPPASFWLWIIGIYAAFFQIASTRYENRVDIIENRINGIYSQISKDIKIAFERIPDVQNMECPYKPNIFNPASIFKSFLPVTNGFYKISDLLKENKKNPIRKFFIENFSLEQVRYQDGVEQLKELVEDWSEKTKIIKDEKGKKTEIGELEGFNLNEAQLQYADLQGAQLQYADLNEAQLQNANLDSSKLQNAGLWSAQLQNANLSSAQLQNVNLFVAQLQYAKLSASKLQNTNLYEAQLKDANLSDANLQNACLCYADLKDVKDLTYLQLSKAFSLYGVKNLNPYLKKKVNATSPHLFQPNYEVRECNDKKKGAWFSDYINRPQNQ
ncbi:MAG: pentapeptide repeat-containing protein [Deltaproteobacteria bacterium]|nr:pentapeptide repeat-containing protein [Deltaproteobacteria bacterium]